MCHNTHANKSLRKMIEKSNCTLSQKVYVIETFIREAEMFVNIYELYHFISPILLEACKGKSTNKLLAGQILDREKYSV